ncbi:factor associated with metabolism and energy isoform X2 [Alexandromys fortis]|uniref:factor associated with metabolism and energy isoform X2 n=1 Tax=Alexandromys fortis TaxID=100897 RepID=UPI00215364E3|nr:uncharacterized protein CCDC198 isoform X2 [Microtus fortis]
MKETPVLRNGPGPLQASVSGDQSHTFTKPRGGDSLSWPCVLRIKSEPGRKELIPILETAGPKSSSRKTATTSPRNLVWKTSCRSMCLDIPLKHEESSIIKRHPPRRIQLDPIDLPQVITSEQLLRQPEARTGHKAEQEPGKKMQLSMYTSGKRQYLHKMQMLERIHKRQEAQMELMNSLQSATRLDMQKQKDHNGDKITQSLPRNDSYDVITILPDETINRDPGSSQDEELLDDHRENDYCVRKIGKMEAWLREQDTQGRLFWSSSSYDSDEFEKDQKRPQALVRTRTERIPLYDEFYDRE